MVRCQGGEARKLPKAQRDEVFNLPSPNHQPTWCEGICVRWLQLYPYRRGFQGEEKKLPFRKSWTEAEARQRLATRPAMNQPVSSTVVALTLLNWMAKINPKWHHWCQWTHPFPTCLHVLPTETFCDFSGFCSAQFSLCKSCVELLSNSGKQLVGFLWPASLGFQEYKRRNATHFLQGQICVSCRPINELFQNSIFSSRRWKFSSLQILA